MNKIQTCIYLVKMSERKITEEEAEELHDYFLGEKKSLTSNKIIKTTIRIPYDEIKIKGYLPDILNNFNDGYWETTINDFINCQDMNQIKYAMCCYKDASIQVLPESTNLHLIILLAA